MKKKIILAFTVSVIFTGCGQNPLKVPTYANQKHIKDTVTATKNKENFFPEYGSSFNNKDDPELAMAYLRSGILLTRSQCYSVLDELAVKDNNNRYQKGQFGILVLLASGILGLESNDSDDIAKLALGAAAVDSSYDLYRNHYLLGPDSDAIVEMTKRAMETVHAEIMQTPPKDFLDAFSKLQSYSQVCTYASIRRLVRQTIQSANFKAESPLIDQQSRILQDKIAEVYGRTAITEEELYGLWIVLFKDPQDTDMQTHIKSYLGDLDYQTIKSDMQKAAEAKNYLWQMTNTRAYYEDRYKSLLDDLASAEKDRQIAVGGAARSQLTNDVVIDIFTNQKADLQHPTKVKNAVLEKHRGQNILDVQSVSTTGQLIRVVPSTQ